MHCQADEHFSGSYTAASPTVISPAATSPAVTLLAVASLATASALMDDPDAARLKLGNLVKEIIAGQATVTKLKGAGEQAIRGLEEARKSMAHAELMVQKSMEELKGVGDAFGPHLRPRFRDPSWSRLSPYQRRLSPYQRLGPDPGLSSQYLAA